MILQFPILKWNLKVLQLQQPNAKKHKYSTDIKLKVADLLCLKLSFSNILRYKIYLCSKNLVSICEPKSKCWSSVKIIRDSTQSKTRTSPKTQVKDSWSKQVGKIACTKSTKSFYLVSSPLLWDSQGLLNTSELLQAVQDAVLFL